MSAFDRCIAKLANVSMRDVALVGGKNASLGELLQHLAAAGERVVGGVATTTAAYRDFPAARGSRACSTSAIRPSRA